MTMEERCEWRTLSPRRQVGAAKVGHRGNAGAPSDNGAIAQQDLVVWRILRGMPAILRIIRLWSIQSDHAAFFFNQPLTGLFGEVGMVAKILIGSEVSVPVKTYDNALDRPPAECFLEIADFHLLKLFRVREIDD